MPIFRLDALPRHGRRLDARPEIRDYTQLFYQLAAKGGSGHLGRNVSLQRLALDHDTGHAVIVQIVGDGVMRYRVDAN